MQTEPAFTETELARRWNVSNKPLQRWRSEERGPPYIKLSKAIRQGMSHEVPLPSLNEAQPVVESPAPAAPEPNRYYLSEAFALIAQYGRSVVFTVCQAHR